MANTKSAIKAARQTERRTLRNKAVKTRLKTLRKKLTTAKGADDAEAAKAAAIAYVSAMDRAAKVGVIHKNAASRAKSHTAKLILTK